VGIDVLRRLADQRRRRGHDGCLVGARETGQSRAMSGPRPEATPSDHPHEVAHDKTGQPETAPAGTAVSGFPEPAGKDPGDVSRKPSPYFALNTPVTEPDPTEWPDPYDRREDPRAPADEMVFPGDGRAHTHVGATSNSEPHPADDIEAIGTNAPDTAQLDDDE
jgi:hypothetical protein